jgi:AcrR family transcriptional regulator
MRTIVYIYVPTSFEGYATDHQDRTRIPRSLPRGRAHLPREVVLVSQRARLVEATIDAVGARGYAATTVGDIIKAARVSRTTFYEQFRDKEECFIASYEVAAGAQLEHVLSATTGITSPMQCLQLGVRAYLEVLTNEPAYASAALVEVLAAGLGAAASRDAVHRRYATLLQRWHGRARTEDPRIPQIPDELFDAAVGGVSDLLATTVRGGTEQLTGLAPVIVTFLLNAGAVPAGRELAAALSASRARRTTVGDP